MTFINYAAREINCKIVYYGPGLCGKTTNLQYIYNKTNPDAKGKMITIELVVGEQPDTASIARATPGAAPDAASDSPVAGTSVNTMSCTLKTAFLLLYPGGY